MGESMVVATNSEDKMVMTAASSPAPEASVSFGRFESDSLSWEKWSSFSQNKYLEEVGKCATPGSVAQKKAYFEAHYKKMAARKTELVDHQEQVTERDEPLGTDVQNGGDLIDNASIQESVLDASDSQTSSEGDLQMVEPKLEMEVESNPSGELDEDNAVSTEGHGLLVDIIMNGHISKESQETDVVNEEGGPVVETQCEKYQPDYLEKEMKVDVVSKVEEEADKLDMKKEPRKMIPMSKVTEKARVKKKPLPAQTKEVLISTPKVTKPVSASHGIRMRQSSTPKSSKSGPTPSGPSSVTKTRQFSTPKASKPTPAPAPLSALRFSSKKEVNSSIPWSKNHPPGETKKLIPKSLHISLNLESPKTEPVPYKTTRSLFIMEKMKDKDIVRRAFKTFEKNFDQLKSSAVERCPANQAPFKGNETKSSSSLVLRKEKGGSIKAGAVDKKTAKAAPRELPKNFYARSVDTMLLRPKSKDVKESEIKKLRQSLNEKPTQVLAFNQGQKVSKSPLGKGGWKTLGM